MKTPRACEYFCGTVYFSARGDPVQVPLRPSLLQETHALSSDCELLTQHLLRPEAFLGYFSPASDLYSIGACCVEVLLQFDLLLKTVQASFFTC